MALALELARFEAAAHGIEAAPGLERPVERRDLARFGRVEFQILVDADADERREIEHAGHRIAGRHQIGRRLRIERRPVGRHHGAGEMAAGRMADKKHRPIVALPHEHAGAADLLDDVGDGDIRAQIVAGDRDNDAVRVEAARHLAEHRGIERAPPAAMDENRKRRRLARRRKEQIDDLPRRIAVGQAKLGAPGFERLGAIIFAFAYPAGENLRMFRHAGAIVVFDFVIDGGHRRLRQIVRATLRQAAATGKWPPVPPNLRHRQRAEIC